MSIFGFKPMSVFARMLCAAGIALSCSSTVFAQDALGSSVAPAGTSAEASSVNFNIPAQPLTSALSEFARQSGQQLLFSPEIVSGKIAGPVQGAMPPLEALDLLLSGSDLVRTLTPSGAILINGADYSAGPGSPKADGSNGSEGAAVGMDSPVAAATGATTTASAMQISQRDGIEEIIVTGQKKEERIQDVPIAISAFSMENLDNQKIEGGFDLLKAVPNVTFSKSNFTGYNFQIRGIGTQAISATTDPGVAVSFNNTTLIVNRLFEQEYLDIERVEVLRGPQGTLFGRNATAGVINVITAKPEMGVAYGEMKLETGNYGAQRFRGHVNTPIMNSDTLAFRGAFALTKRDGYGTNLAAKDQDIQEFIRDHDRAPVSDNIDNRDLWTGRVSLGWQPTDSFRANLIYERFEEDDRRMRSTKQLCHHHDGRVTLYDEDGNPVVYDDAFNPGLSANARRNALGQTSQGCLPGSLFDKGDPTSAAATSHGAYGTPNGNSMPFVRAGRGSLFNIGTAPFPADPACSSGLLISNCVFDPMATVNGQSRDMRDIFSLIDPRYQALSELFDLSLDLDLDEGLTLSSQTVYMDNELFSTQDFLRFRTSPMFGASHNAIHPYKRSVTPNGIFDDPQLGKSNRLLMQDVSQLESRQFSQELRLVSSFDGPINYSIGANYTRFQNTADYFVFINSLSAFALAGAPYSAPISNFTGLGMGLWAGDPGGGMPIGCGTFYAYSYTTPDTGTSQIGNCIYIQEGSIDEVRGNPEGHNFFMSRNPFLLNSAGLFGELYVDLTPALKFTAGLRMNWDRKSFTPTPSQTLLADWRGRLQGGSFPGNADLWGNPNNPNSRASNPDMVAACHPQSPTRINVYLWQATCALGGMAEKGRGYPTLPDIVQEWRVPTGRIGLDWKLDTGFTDETLVYAFYTRGYKAGGANPPTQSAPSGLLLEVAQGAAAPRVFEAEYVNAFELGTKNRLLGGAVTVNGTAFYYDYSDYQVSKIVDRTAINENFDATIWGLELETVFAPTPDTLLNASIGYLRTRIADGEQSLDLMDRTQGGNNAYVDPGWSDLPTTGPLGQALNCGTANAHIACRFPNGFDQWIIIRPTLTQASSCVAPAVLIYELLRDNASITGDDMSALCPAGKIVEAGYAAPIGYSPFTSAPNGSAGFLADVSGNELPNAPRFTVSLGAQHTYWLSQDWSATARADWYWQDKSYNRVYNTEYDRLRDWTNTNLSVWVTNERLGLTIETYIKNVFDETPITGAFLNSDDTGLSTNVFTLDPRLVGVSIRKRF